MSHRVEVIDDSHRNAVATEDRQLTVLRSMNISLSVSVFCSSITRQSIRGQLPVLRNCQLFLYLFYFCICMLMHLSLHCSIVVCSVACCNLKSTHCAKILRTVPWSDASVLSARQLGAISPLVRVRKPHVGEENGASSSLVMQDAITPCWRRCEILVLTVTRTILFSSFAPRSRARIDTYGLRDGEENGASPFQ